MFPQEMVNEKGKQWGEEREGETGKEKRYHRCGVLEQSYLLVGATAEQILSSILDRLVSVYFFYASNLSQPMQIHGMDHKDGMGHQAQEKM